MCWLELWVLMVASGLTALQVSVPGRGVGGQVWGCLCLCWVLDANIPKDTLVEGIWLLPKCFITLYSPEVMPSSPALIAYVRREKQYTYSLSYFFFFI